MLRVHSRLESRAQLPQKGSVSKGVVFLEVDLCVLYVLDLTTGLVVAGRDVCAEVQEFAFELAELRVLYAWRPTSCRVPLEVDFFRG